MRKPGPVKSKPFQAYALCFVLFAIRVNAESPLSQQRYNFSYENGLNYGGSFYTGFRGEHEKYVSMNSGWGVVMRDGSFRRWRQSLALSIPMSIEPNEDHHNDPHLLINARSATDSVLKRAREFIFTHAPQYYGSYFKGYRNKVGNDVLNENEKYLLTNQGWAVLTSNGCIFQFVAASFADDLRRCRDQRVGLVLLNPNYYKSPSLLFRTTDDDIQLRARARALDFHYNLHPSGYHYYNVRGQREKYVPFFGGWLVIFIDGTIAEFVGGATFEDLSRCRIIAKLNSDFHDDPSLLENAFENADEVSRKATQLAFEYVLSYGAPDADGTVIVASYQTNELGHGERSLYYGSERVVIMPDGRVLKPNPDVCAEDRRGHQVVILNPDFFNHPSLLLHAGNIANRSVHPTQNGNFPKIPVPPSPILSEVVIPRRSNFDFSFCNPPPECEGSGCQEDPDPSGDPFGGGGTDVTL